MDRRSFIKNSVMATATLVPATDIGLEARQEITERPNTDNKAAQAAASDLVIKIGELVSNMKDKKQALGKDAALCDTIIELTNTYYKKSNPGGQIRAQDFFYCIDSGKTANSGLAIVIDPYLKSIVALKGEIPSSLIGDDSASETNNELSSGNFKFPIDKVLRDLRAGFYAQKHPAALTTEDKAYELAVLRLQATAFAAIVRDREAVMYPHGHPHYLMPTFRQAYLEKKTPSEDLGRS